MMPAVVLLGLYFVSDRPAPGLEPNRFHAWAVDRTATGWSRLRPLQGPVNEKGNTEFVSFAGNGNLYFTSDRGNSFDVYCSRLVNGKYQPAESLGAAINDGRYTIEAFVAPDESYLLLGSFARDSLGNADVYISYNHAGTWSKPSIWARRSIRGRATTVRASLPTESTCCFPASEAFLPKSATSLSPTANSWNVCREP